jgi:hypothetical protein
MVISPKPYREVQISELPGRDQLKKLDTLVIKASISDEAFNSLVSSSSARFLKQVSHGSTKFQSSQLRRIVDVLKNLETLHCSGGYTSAFDSATYTSAVAAIGKGCPLLAKLKISISLNAVVLESFANHHLRVLHLLYSDLTSDYLAALLRRPSMTTLEDLVLRRNSIPATCSSRLQQIVAACEKLY